MALQYLFDPNKQFQSLGGVNEVGGFLRVFFNGTDDRATTYRNFDGGLNEPDIVLDSYGRAVVIVDDTKTYRLEAYNRFGGLMWTVSNYKARGGRGGSGTPVSVEGTAGEIDVYENTVGGVKHFVVGLATTIKNAISSLTSAVNGLALSLGNKKERQTAKEFLGSTTKTVVGVTQDENGEISATFDDIAFPDWTSAINAAVATCEKTANKKNTLTGYESNTTAYPSIKAVVDFVNAAVATCEKTANKKNTLTGYESSTTAYPSIKAVVDFVNAAMQNIANWFSDLKALAFKDKVSDSDISGTIADDHIASASTWNGKQNALPTTGTPSSTFAINVSGTARYSENVLPYYVRADNDKSWLEVGTYKANNSDEMYTGITFAVKFRSDDGHTQSGFVWISVGEWKSGGGFSNADIVCEYYTLGRRVKEPPESVKLYVNILGTSVTDGVKIYAYLSGYSNISLTPLNVNNGTYTSSMTYLDAEPATKKEVTYCNLLRSTYGTAIGGSSTPIYVDEYGIPRPCSSIPTPQTVSWCGEASTTATGVSNGGMIRFSASLDLGHGWGDGTHGFINYEVNCSSSSRKGESVCFVSIVPGYVGSQGIRFLGYPFKFVENPQSYTNGTGVHVCGIGDCWISSLRTIPSRLIVQVDTDASKFSVGDTLGISVRVTATKLL